MLAARTFIIQFLSQITSKRPELVSTLQSTPIPIGNSKGAQPDEMIFTVDSVLNFTQLAVRTCQRAQGAQNKTMREAWVRLCGTYQSKGGLMGTKEVRKVRAIALFSHFRRCRHCRPGIRACASCLSHTGHPVMPLVICDSSLCCVPSCCRTATIPALTLLMR